MKTLEKHWETQCTMSSKQVTYRGPHGTWRTNFSIFARSPLGSQGHNISGEAIGILMVLYLFFIIIQYQKMDAYPLSRNASIPRFAWFSKVTLKDTGALFLNLLSWSPLPRSPAAGSRDLLSAVGCTHTATFGAWKAHASRLPSDANWAWRTWPTIFPRSTLQDWQTAGR